MDILKRLAAYLFIVLLIGSLYKDFTSGLFFQSNNPCPSNLHYQTITVKVEYSDTTLSIIEQINAENIDQFNINQMITDFKQLNPETNPYELSPGTEYFFPLYCE